MYKVLSTFADLQDSNHLYNVGDVYPRAGYTPSDGRLEELSTVNNRLRKPLIEKIEEPTETVEQPKPRKRKKADD